MLRRRQKQSQADQEETGLRAWSHPMGWKVQEVGGSEATFQGSKLGRSISKAQAVRVQRLCNHRGRDNGSIEQET